MEFLRHIFAFDSNSPLLFTQFYFWAFFALVYAVFAIIMEVNSPSGYSQKRRDNQGTNTRLHLRNIFLMAVSWFFYYKTSGLFLLILLFVTLSDWLIAQRIYINKERNTKNGERNAQCWLALSRVIDLGLFC